MKLLKHPNILPLYAAFLDDDQLWMVMPYVSGGSASDIMRRTSPSVRLCSTCLASHHSTDCTLRRFQALGSMCGETEACVWQDTQRLASQHGPPVWTAHTKL